MGEGPLPLALLRGAVEIPSVSGDEGEVARYFVGALRGFCREAEIDAAGNAVGVVGEGPLRVTFLGHIDTVPGEPPVRVADGRLYGRGAVDAKGPFAAAVCAAARLSAAARARLTLRLIGAVGEEAPGSHGARHAVAVYERPDLLLVGEPSGWDAVTLGYKGRLVVRVEARKDDFHSAGDGTTASEDAVEAWLRLRAWADGATPDASGIFDRIQCALQAVDGGRDGLEQRATAVVGLRLPPAWPPQRVVGALEGLELPDGVRLSFHAPEAPVRGPRDTVLTRAFRVAIRQAGGRPRTNVKTGTSDMNVVAPHWDVPMLAYGPGDSALDHTPDEHVEIEELERAVEVLHAALERLAAGPA